MKTIALGHKQAGLDCRPIIVAEMSGNHNQSLDRALQLVDAAADAGADVLKLQTYTADTMTIDLDCNEFFIDDEKSLWHGQSLYRLYQQAYTPWEWHEPIFKRCRERGVLGFSTPFDATAVDFLESLDVPFYKIASCENTDLPLIRKVASTGKPLIMSTAMMSEEELEESVAAARQAGCNDLILLKCTCAYPASVGDANLATIPAMRERFGVLTGLSDHTLGTTVSVASVALGAVLIEKHFTLSRSDGGVDSAFSLEQEELKQLVEETGIAWQAIGRPCYGPSENEVASLTYRRSLYVVNDIKAGDTFTTDNLRAIRPGLGLPPKFYEQLLGKTLTQDVIKGTPVAWGLVSPAA